MTRFASRSLLLAGLCAGLSASGAAWAGSVYVPLPGITTVGGAPYETQISISNLGIAARTLNQVLLPNDTDGTQRAGTPPTLVVQPGRTAVLKPAASFGGLLELSGGIEPRYGARLVGTGGAGQLGTYLPVLTSENLIKGGTTLALQGLLSGGTRTADLDLINLGKAAAQCTVNLTRADGSAIGTSASVTLKPLSQRYFANLFNGLIDASGVTEARAAITCNQTFFAFSLLADSATGLITYVGPSGSGASLLAVPGAPESCPAGATCLDHAGLVHMPTPATPVARATFPLAAGVVTRFRLQLDVSVAGFYPLDPDGKHLIYWFVINKNLDMPGLLYFRGPDAYTALARHGMGLTHPQKLKVVSPFQAVPGRTYHVDNDYDMAGGVYTITVTDAATGEVKATLRSTPNVRSFTTRAGDNILIDMGFKEGLVPDEVPSYNWRYSNIHVEVYTQ